VTRRSTLWLVAVVACAPPVPPAGPTPTGLVRAESLYAELRALRDRVDVSLAAGQPATPDGTPVDALAGQYRALRVQVHRELDRVPAFRLGGADLRAIGVMRAALENELGELPSVTGVSETAPDCDYAAPAIAGLPNGLDSLKKRAYACYGWAQHHVMVGGRRLDRLSVLAALGRTENREERRRLFLSLDPVWRTINGDNSPSSPFRQMVTLVARKSGALPAAARARALGLEADTLEAWLVSMLEAWRAAAPDSLLEPWDWHYQGGAASRRLSPQIPPERLLEINTAVFRGLGADPDSLRIQYDLVPREGKTPVAFTTFGARPRQVNGLWRPGEPWIFATYRAGGLDNLNELLHETGHAVHIAAVRTRPAFADWPDSDPFTEGLADLVALDVYEPRWQERWLGDSATTEESMRGRYAGIVLDVAWALFEIRMHRSPGSDPNQVWSDLTHQYLRIRPHPELSWWAMRGQLVDLPGYMLNYAAGAVIVAAIRERIRAEHGPFVTGDPTWYGWVAPRLFRFGLERPSRLVITEFLGGPITPAAILRDMARLKG
jgi:hypothetical protein